MKTILFTSLTFLFMLFLSCRKDSITNQTSNAGNPHWEDVLIYSKPGDTTSLYYHTGITIYDLDFISSERVIAIGSNNDSYTKKPQCWISEDKGQSWTSGGSVGGEGKFGRCSFINKDTGYAVNFNFYTTPNLRITTDGGYNWSLIGPQDLTGPGAPNIYDDIHFIDYQTGFLGNHKTSDGGLTWTELPDLTSISDFHFLSTSTGFAVGSNGKIYKTSNTGTNWTELSSPTSNNLSRCYFVNESLGFVCSQTVLYRTNDGGGNWSQLLDSAITDIYFKNEEIGFVSTQSSILKTDDGGVNWSINLTSDFYQLKALAGIDNIVLAGGNNLDSGIKPVAYVWYKDFILRTQTLGD